MNSSLRGAEYIVNAISPDRTANISSSASQRRATSSGDLGRNKFAANVYRRGCPPLTCVLFAYVFDLYSCGLPPR
jgi:hypothetical protein